MSRFSPTLHRLAGRLTAASRPPSVGPIGFELGESTLHLLQLERADNGLCIRAASATAYPCPRDQLLANTRRLRRFLRAALAQQPFVGRRIVACTPPDKLRLMLLEYSVAEGAEEGATIMHDVLQRIGGGADDWVIDYLPLRRAVRDDRSRAALVAVVAHDEQIAYLEMLRHAGMDVAALEIGPVAIRRLVVATGAVEQGEFNNVLVINVGREKTYLTVISGRRLLLDREIPFGEAQLLARLSEALQMGDSDVQRLLRDYGFGHAEGDAAEIVAAVTEIARPVLRELQREVDKVVLYLSSQLRGAGVDAVYLLGSLARLPGAPALFGEALGRQVAVLDPFAGFLAANETLNVDQLEPIAGMALASGCALRGMEADV